MYQCDGGRLCENLARDLILTYIEKPIPYTFREKTKTIHIVGFNHHRGEKRAKGCLVTVNSSHFSIAFGECNLLLLSLNGHVTFIDRCIAPRAAWHGALHTKCGYDVRENALCRPQICLCL